MQRWKFSISTLLVATAVVATWLWVNLLLPGGEGAPLRVIPLVGLVLLTLVFRFGIRSSKIPWMIAALFAGLTVIGAVAIVALTDDSSIVERIP